MTPFHVSFQPRTIREADSLAAAGHDVRVVSCRSDADLVPRDERLMRRRSWRLQTVDLRRRGPTHGRWLAAALWSRCNHLAFGCGMRSAGVAARAYLRGYGRLLTMAAAEPTDWYIAHTQPALGVAAAAARRRRARLGFDCEDLLADTGIDPAELVRSVEGAYLGECSYVSVPSRGIAAELVSRYRVSPPVVLHNVFPAAHAAGLSPPEQRPAAARLRLHWFGQTAGPGRGLEEAIDAAGLLDAPADMHVRSRMADDYARELRARAARQPSPPTLHFHEVVDHDDLVRSLAEFDVALCLERPEHGNYGRTITNKLFSSLLAGLAIAATDTEGQREVLSAAPGVGFLYRAGDVSALAVGLSVWQRSEVALRTTQTAAWDEARRRFCWEREEGSFLRALGLAP